MIRLKEESMDGLPPKPPSNLTCNKYNLPEHTSFNSVVNCFRCTGMHSFIAMSRLTLPYNHYNVFPTVSVYITF